MEEFPDVIKGIMKRLSCTLSSLTLQEKVDRRCLIKATECQNHRPPPQADSRAITSPKYGPIFVGRPIQAT